MPGGLELVGQDKILADLRALQERIAEPGAALEVEMGVLEAAEGELFDSYGGKFVGAGDYWGYPAGTVKASLTESTADGAIRRIHGNILEFGTSIWYARFLRNIGGPSGKPRGRKRIGPNLVLELTPAMRLAAIKALADRIVGRQ